MLGRQRFWFHALIIGAILLAFCQTIFPLQTASAADRSVTIVATYQADAEVILNISEMFDITTLDPQQMFDVSSVDAVENLFHGLTDYDPVTHAVVPELATHWEISEDGTIWTFTLRNDVMWYRYDPATETANELRPVVAADVVYGIKRSCDPRFNAYYSAVSASVIAGCEEVYYTPYEETSDELVFGDTVRVTAPDDTTVIIELQYAASYFLSMTPMWMLRPVHQETIEEFGEEWTLPGNIATNGPYFLHEMTYGVRRIFVRNENHPATLSYGGNIDVIQIDVLYGEGLMLYDENLLDRTEISSYDFKAILEDSNYQAELHPVLGSTVMYFAFAHDKPPFDDVHVRRAFSAIIDRSLFVEEWLEGRGIPMIHFTPPGMAYAVGINEVGVGFDPEYALEELEAAGYPNCEGMPVISAAGAYMEFLRQAAEEYLGCSPDIFTSDFFSFDSTDATTPTEQRPNLWSIGWMADYGDANNWVGDVLWCQGDNSFLRPCSEIDDMIQEAAQTSDPAERERLYREIEEGFFGEEGEFPIAPLYMVLDYALVKPWYTGPHDSDGNFGGKHWDAYSVDMVAKIAARGESTSEDE